MATQMAPVANRGIVSENSIPGSGGETEGDTPSKVCVLYSLGDRVLNSWQPKCMLHDTAMPQHSTPLLWLSEACVLQNSYLVGVLCPLAFIGSCSSTTSMNNLYIKLPACYLNAHCSVMNRCMS